MLPRHLQPRGSKAVIVGGALAVIGLIALAYSRTPRVVYIMPNPAVASYHSLFANNTQTITNGTGPALKTGPASPAQPAPVPASTGISSHTDSAKPKLSDSGPIHKNKPGQVPPKTNSPKPVRKELPPLPDPNKPRPLLLGEKEKAPTECPPKLHFAKNLPKTALFSVPGSGNTWVRHLLQQSTGIYTGAVYNDGSIRSKGFLGEGKTDGTVVAIKTHEAGARVRSKFQRAILIYRVPMESAMAEFNRRRAGHVGVASTATLQAGAKSRLGEVNSIIKRWRNTNRDWIMNFTAPLHVVHYADLKTNLTVELRKMLEFLNWDVTEEQLQCVAKHAEGQFHRKKNNAKPDKFFTDEQKSEMKNMIPEIDSYFEERRKRGFELSM